MYHPGMIPGTRALSAEATGRRASRTSRGTALCNTRVHIVRDQPCRERGAPLQCHAMLATRAPPSGGGRRRSAPCVSAGLICSLADNRHSPGHLAAFESNIDFLPNGPREDISRERSQCPNLCLSGKTSTQAISGHRPTLVQDRKIPVAEGKIGGLILPNATDTYDPISGTWISFSLNLAGGIDGGSRRCVNSCFSRNQPMPYDFRCRGIHGFV